MQLHELQPKTRRQTAKRIGRGGKRGKTSGRGMKGQKSRTGNSMRPEIRDMIKKLPKLRGHGKNRARTVNAEKVRPIVVNLSALEAAFAAGDQVTPDALVAKEVVSSQKKRAPRIKILGNGTLSKKLSVVGCEVSKSAAAAIEKAGGSVTQ